MTTQLRLLNKLANSDSLEQVRSYLLQEPSIQDCAVLKLENKLVAYVVSGSNLATRWHDYLKVYLPDELLPSAYVLISNLPLTRPGAIDTAALSKLEILDENLVKHWETELAKHPAIAEAVVVVQDCQITETPLHLDYQQS